ncbi:glycosyltransferase [Vibrio sp. B1FLJ16]|uniref:glycosyltransferase family 2 protein n=1 Tax=Vibrio sp. B1FLJ16 TaxID=2751178 RepID=UPI0015F368E0|nr:glycosyltransferase [Vibrio sp. B1FLJ16]CAD7807320.1 Glycosyl transferase [Vibrio sp. B1FLJ16]CAE6905362.1 Glycosyl transferase [Vibrio sp. B1FLJ16]
MKKLTRILPSSLVNALKRQEWAVRAYQRYVLKQTPIHGLLNYDLICTQQDNLLAGLPSANGSILFSIVVPVYKPDLALLQEMVSSVREQTYTNWQLVLVDDGSECEFLSQSLNQLESEQIKVVVRDQNGHISAASNTGLEHASGDFVALLDQDDLLHPEALRCMAYYLALYPNANVLYSDEDKVDAEGHRSEPHFKPSFNLDLLYSHNYISHLGIYRRSLLENIGGFRLGYEGSQDYDLLLRCVAQSHPDQIIHVPYVLYHWRAIAGSTALAESEKGYAQQAGLKALSDHLAPDGVQVSEGKLANTYKVTWPLPTDLPLVSIIIPTKNGQALVKQCIESIYRLTTYANFEILLVENGSDDPQALAYFAELNKQGKVRLLDYPHAFNYSAINNYAVSKAKGEYLVLMNNDIEILAANWLEEMVGHLTQPSVGCVGAKLYYPNGTLQHAGVITGLGGVAGHSHKHFPGDHPGYFKRLQLTQVLSAVTAACLGVRKEVYHQVGGLNEQDLTVAFNDVDFCLKVREAGFNNIWSPYIEMVHHESISRGHEDTPEKQARFAKEIEYMKRTWGDALLSDPHYSQWLTLDREDFSYRL